MSIPAGTVAAILMPCWPIIRSPNREATPGEDRRRVDLGNVGVDVDIQGAASARVAYRHHCLECGSAHHVTAEHVLQRLSGTHIHDSMPVCLVLHRVRAGLYPRPDSRWHWRWLCIRTRC